LLPPGWKYKLPTTKQWSYVAHLAGIPADANELINYAWMIKNSPQRTSSPVGAKNSSPQIPGLYDLVGNVWELTSTPNDTGDGSIIAGGAFDSSSMLLIKNLNGDFSQSLAKDERRKDIGFRVILVAEK
jgi:formylglycine-generating enzyme required for sulfatase activity